MNLKIHNLEECFRVAKEKGVKWVAIRIKSDYLPNDTDEIDLILNSKFDTELEYYKKSYTDDLILKVDNRVKVVGFTYGDTVTDVSNDLTESDE